MKMNDDSTNDWITIYNEQQNKKKGTKYVVNKR